MKHYIFSVLLLWLFASNLLAQHTAFDDIIYPPKSDRADFSPTLWEETTLYYYVSNSSNDLSFSQCQTAIQNAFDTWSQYSRFSFIQTFDLSQADIKLSWEIGHHGSLCSDFTDTSIVAHATRGMLTSLSPPGQIHFNDLCTFSTDGTQFDVETVALHEIGHVLGIADNYDNSSYVMYGVIPSGTIKRNLTSYDYNALYSIYGFPSSIDGPHLICSVDTFSIDNIDKLPSIFTVSWSLSDNHYNNGYNLLIPNFPSKGHCLIVRDQNYDMKNATLTAAIKKGNDTIKILQKADINAYDDFWGQYTSGNLSGEIDYSHYFNMKPNTTTTVTSPNFYGATVTYDSSGATPTAWGFNPTNSVLNFKASAGSTVVINVLDGFQNQYTLYAHALSSYLMNISYGDNSITVSLDEEGGTETGLSLNLPWKVEISNATTGELMATRSSTSRSATINTAGWPKGMYVVRVTVGKEVMTEKVMVG